MDPDLQELFLDVVDMLQNWVRCPGQYYTYISDSGSDNNEADTTYEPPKTFTKLGELHKIQGLINVVGVVSKITMKETKGTDKLLLMDLCDPSNVENPVKVLYFRRDASQFPEIKENGDGIVLRNVKSQLFNGKPQLISNYSTTFLVVPRHDPTALANVASVPLRQTLAQLLQ